MLRRVLRRRVVRAKSSTFHVKPPSRHRAGLRQLAVKRELAWTVVMSQRWSDVGFWSGSAARP